MSDLHCSCPIGNQWHWSQHQNPTISSLSTPKTHMQSISPLSSLFLLKPAAAWHISSLTMKLDTSDGKTISSRNHKISRHVNSFNRFSVSLSFTTSSIKLVRPQRVLEENRPKREAAVIHSCIDLIIKTSQGKNNNTQLIKCANTEFTRSICERISCPLCEKMQNNICQEPIEMWLIDWILSQSRIRWRAAEKTTCSPCCCSGFHQQTLTRDWLQVWIWV